MFSFVQNPSFHKNFSSKIVLEVSQKKIWKIPEKEKKIPKKYHKRNWVLLQRSRIVQEIDLHSFVLSSICLSDRWWPITSIIVINIKIHHHHHHYHQNAIFIIIAIFMSFFSVGQCLFLVRTPEQFSFSLIHWGNLFLFVVSCYWFLSTEANICCLLL